MKIESMPLTADEESLVLRKINAYADSMAPQNPHTEEEQLVLKAADGDGNTAGGCIVNVHLWGRAVLAKLWVDGRYRRHGLGSMLLRAAEEAAREKDCYTLCLGTADFMARPFYEKHGFRVFTVNRDIPPGHISWSLSKRIDRASPDYVPSDNTAEGSFRIEPGTEEDAETVSRGLREFCDENIEDRHAYIPLSRKLVDRKGDLLAAVVAGVEEDDSTEIDGIWVEEGYRRQGFGTRLLEEITREAKEKGSYVLLTYCCDWVSGFFFRNEFIPRGELEDYPRGHTAYELEKRI